MTIGEDRVRTKFNPSAVDLVDQIKQKTAELINLCHDMEISGGESLRCAIEAEKAYEEAAMWAVKAATAEK